MKTPFETFVAYLEANDWHFTIQEAVRVLTANVSSRSGRWSCVFLVDEGDHFVAFSSLLPCIVPPDRRAACLELLNQINWRLRFGNFEMEPKNGDIEFRHSFPLLDGLLPEAAPHFLVDITRGATNQYLPAIMRVVYANATPAEALNRKRVPNKRTPKPRFEMN